MEKHHSQKGNRQHSLELKEQLVAQYLQGNQTLKQVAGPYGIHPALLCQWVKKSAAKPNSTTCAEPSQAQGSKNPKREAQKTYQSPNKQEVESEIEVLQKALQQERLKNEALHALLDAAEEATGRPIRKKTGPGQ